MRYRPEIDGLRAIAVVPVILFHAGLSWFSGGFVGVDVFFVISGYLITGIIMKEVLSGDFSFLRFYERRFRRIAPAFIVVLLFCMILTWVFLLPAELVSFYWSLIYSCVFSANIFFRGEAGYFETASELKPLLHVWSLSVEEQFYLVFPIALVLLSKFGRHKVLVFLAVGICVSLYYAETRNTTRAEAAFFIIKYRAWELGLGAFTAVMFAEGPRPGKDLAKEVFCWAGLSLIVFSIFHFDHSTPFPGLWALIPTLGSVLILVFADEATYFGRLLRSRFLVVLGTSSYGAYLWHNPIFVFTRYFYANEPSLAVLLLMAGVSLVLGFLSAKFIEKPFRDGRRIPLATLAWSTGVPLLIFVGVSFLGVWKSGFYERYSLEQIALLRSGETPLRENLRSYDLGHCFIDYEQTVDALLTNQCVSDTPKRRVIVFGDSKAAHWMAGVKRAFVSDDFFVQQWTGTSCRAVDYPKNSARCKDFYRVFIEKIAPQIRPSDIIIVSSRWIGVLTDSGTSSFALSVRALFDVLKATNAEIVVIGDTPEFPLPPQSLMVRQRIRNVGEVYLKAEEVASANTILADEAKNYGYTFRDPTTYLCKRDDERHCMVARNGEFYYFDAGHLSPLGSTTLFEDFALSKQPQKP
ncbi:Lipopolysaccharide modification acyltransferase [Neorhizobium galegae bv. officinalis bv. officinalis str. HAMBI 1141]|uniref:Lipopolysaccharide modification acyltransferase n=1 Tax=Neorhizobium galegae bv. officinalis bv. officinalis str. HAMBI 1141 TaxID=1028801 RepID=A0A068T268_NEOGA|nr:acyltransferase family protein [Neorhizobium galegae]CDN52552.1 Lipopolysaccharide modification acyltransferase [Neorhizobium galegae bv. officinalis bv. officinalis str. HAMBI 1141]